MPRILRAPLAPLLASTFALVTVGVGSAQTPSATELAAVAAALRANPQAAQALAPIEAPPPPPAALNERQEPPAPKPQASSRELFPGAEPLTPFGYEVFDVGVSMMSGASLPAPIDYELAPGDTLEVLIIGDRGGRFLLSVSRDGEVNIPQIGPVSVAGLKFEEAKRSLEERIAAQISGARANVTLGALRSIDVFLLGEVKTPGPLSVSALSTVSSALMAGGGLKSTGSLRRVELRRSGSVIAKFDLYDLLLKGDASRDLRLMAGDVIFVPAVGSVVGVSGAVKRPGIYELAEGHTERLDAVIKFAGGLATNADARTGLLNRIGEDAQRESQSVDLLAADSMSLRLRDGDFLRIDFNLPITAREVQILGHLHRPGSRAISTGTRLIDLLPNPNELKEGADLGYVFIAREDRYGVVRQALSADLPKAWDDPAGAANVPLVSGDVIFVFRVDQLRQALTNCLLSSGVRSSADCLIEADSEPKEVPVKQLGAVTLAFPQVSVLGAVRVPGDYPFESGMRIADVVRAGGGLLDRAYRVNAELVRYSLDEEKVRRRDISTIDLEKALAGDPAANLSLEPYDELVVRVIPQWSDRAIVRVEGEVMFPGSYPVEAGETLKALLKRAGGLKSTAFASGAFFSRQSLRERELAQVRRLQGELRRDVATQQQELLAAGREDEAAALSRTLAPLLEFAEENPALGRLSIDLPRILNSDTYSEDDLALKDGDRLFVPGRMDEISVIGEVFAQGSHVFVRGAGVKDYIDFSGGLRDTADSRNIYVLNSAGRARPVKGRLVGSQAAEVQPGDAIVVPIRTPKRGRTVLETVREVTQIIYNLSLGASAIKTFRN